jgi:hypothetical protein
VDGNPIGYIDNFSDTNLPKRYNMDVSLGDFSKAFQLGKGEKTVCIPLGYQHCH